MFRKLTMEYDDSNLKCWKANDEKPIFDFLIPVLKTQDIWKD